MGIYRRERKSVSQKAESALSRLARAASGSQLSTSPDAAIPDYFVCPISNRKDSPA